MSVKSAVKTALLLLILAFCHWWIGQDYYPNTIAYPLHQSLTDAQVQALLPHYDQGLFEWEMRQGNDTLIMTTGNSSCHKRFGSHSKFYLLDPGEAIVSQQTLSDLFHTGTAGHQRIQYLGRYFSVKGSLEKGRLIYIGYDPELLNAAWNKTTFYYSAANLDQIELNDDAQIGYFKASGIDTTPLYIKDYLYLYYNLALIILVYWLMHFVLHQWRRLEALLRQNVWRASLKTSIFTLLSGLVATAALVTLPSHFFMARSLFPDNLFSPWAYYTKMTHWHQALQMQMDSGLSPLLFRQAQCLGVLLVGLLWIERYVGKKGKGI